VNHFKCSAYKMLAMCSSVLLLLTGLAANAGNLSSSTVLATQVSAPSRHHHIIAGTRFSYKLSYRGTGRTDFGVLFQEQNQAAQGLQPTSPGFAQSIQTSVEGRLLVTVVETGKDNIVLSYSLRDATVKLVANGQADNTDAEAIRNELTHDVFVIVDQQGRVFSLQFDPAISEIARSFARTWIAVTQFVSPSGSSAGTSQWETLEEDPNGRYIAKYRRLNAHGGGTGSSGSGSITVQKRILRYLPEARKSSGTEFNLEPAITPAGALTATVAQSSGRLLALNGTQSQVFTLAGKTVAQTQSTVGFSFIGENRLDSAPLAVLQAVHSQLADSVVAVTLWDPISKTRSEASIERTELGTDTSEKLLADLAALEAAPDTQNETRIYLKFKALVYLHPESCAALGQKLSAAAAKSVTMRVLTGALSVVGNPEAQAALVSAIQARPTDWAALSMLIPALNEAGAPTPFAEDTIRELAYESSNPDIASTAQLTLGTMARRLAETSPTRADRIVNSLIEQLNSSRSADLTRQILLALGNAGSVQAVPVIIKFIHDSAPAIRAAAVSALRWIDSDQTNQQLIAALTSDPDSDVRFEAATALGFQKLTPASFASQKQALATDGDSKIRLAVLRNLWKGRLAFPEVRSVAEKAAANDASEDVRKAAMQLLATESAH